MHIHIECEDSEAKFWIEPIVSPATYAGLKPNQLTEIQRIVKRKKDEIAKKWKEHFDKR